MATMRVQDLGLWERSGVQGVLVDEHGGLGASSTTAAQFVRAIVICSLALSRVNEAEALDLHMG
jgi:hypothetical protein